MFNFNEKEFFSRLEPFFLKELYKPIFSKKQFRLETPEGFRNVIIYPSVYPDRVIFEVTFGTRINLVENTMYQYTNGLNDFQPDSNTSIISYGNYHNKNYYRLAANNLEECLFVIEEVKSFFEREGFAYLEKLSHLDMLDHVFNSFPNQKSPFAFNQQTRCFRGATIAKLSDNREFETVVRAYQHQLKNRRAPDFIIEKFNALVIYLRSFSFN